MYDNKTIIIEDDPAELLKAIKTGKEANVKPHVLFRWIYSIVDLYEKLGVSDADLKKCFKSSKDNKLNHIVFYPTISYLCQKEYAKAINDTLAGDHDPISIVLGKEKEILNNIYTQPEVTSKMDAIKKNSAFTHEKLERINKFKNDKTKKTIEIIKDNFKTQYEVLKDSFEHYMESNEFDVHMQALISLLAWEDHYISRIISVCAEGLIDNEDGPFGAFIEGQILLSHLKQIKDNLFNKTIDDDYMMDVLQKTLNNYNGNAIWIDELLTMAKKTKRTFEDNLILLVLGIDLISSEIGHPVFKESVKN